MAARLRTIGASRGPLDARSSGTRAARFGLRSRWPANRRPVVHVLPTEGEAGHRHAVASSAILPP
jgi:hypothetical protein